jgi:AP-1 complex subunit gamma-1
LFYFFLKKAAVPKYLKLEMLPPTSTTIPASSNGVVTQEIRLINTAHGQKNIMLKLKIGYTANGVVVFFIIFFLIIFFD